MPSGDISDALEVQIRGKLNEDSASFWTSANIMSYMTVAQNFLIDIKALRYTDAQNRNKCYDDPILRPLITSSSIAWDTGANTITLPSYRMVLYAELLKSTDTSGQPLPMTMLGYDEMLLRKNNTYIGHSFDNVTGLGQVFYYIGDKLYTSFPTGAHSTYHDKVTVVYLKNPADITTSVDPTLGANCYEAIIEYACYMALQKNNEYEKAKIHLENFLQFAQ